MSSKPWKGKLTLVPPGQHVASRAADENNRAALAAAASPVEPPVDRHQLAADIFASLVARYGNTSPTPSEGDQLAKAAYAYADRFMVAMEARQ